MNIEMEETGLVCDNPACDWKDNTITYENYKEWLNKPCPKCGQNVLTDQDYENAEKLHDHVKLMNSLSPEETLELEKLIASMDEETVANLLASIGIDASTVDLEKPVSMNVSTHEKITIESFKNTEEE